MSYCAKSHKIIYILIISRSKTINYVGNESCMIGRLLGICTFLKNCLTSTASPIIPNTVTFNLIHSFMQHSFVECPLIYARHNSLFLKTIIRLKSVPSRNVQCRKITIKCEKSKADPVGNPFYPSPPHPQNGTAVHSEYVQRSLHGKRILELNFV